MDPATLTAMAALENLAMSAYLALRGQATASWWDLDAEGRDSVRQSVLDELEVFATESGIAPLVADPQPVASSLPDDPND